MNRRSMLKGLFAICAAPKLLLNKLAAPSTYDLSFVVTQQMLEDDIYDAGSYVMFQPFFTKHTSSSFSDLWDDSCEP